MDQALVDDPTASHHARLTRAAKARPHRLARVALGTAAATALLLCSSAAHAVLLDVPFFSQCDSAWGSNQLGTCASTMCTEGCAVTSSAMLYQFYGGSMDPGQLNDCLTGNGGFASGCLIYWSNSCMPAGMSYVGSSGDIDSELAAGRPVIAQVTSAVTSMHFVVIVGNDSGEYQINDPYPPFYATISAGGYTIVGLQLYDGQVAAPCSASASAASELIIDDLDACFMRHGSYWWNDATGYADHNYYTYATDDAAPDCWGEWNFSVQDAGTYEVSVYLPDQASSSLQAGYVVTHAGNDDSVTVDQTSATGWRVLGQYTFDAGDGQRIALFDDTGEPVAGHVPVRFDAIRLAPVGGPPPDGGSGGSGASGGGVPTGGHAAGGTGQGGTTGGAPAGVSGSPDGCNCVLGLDAATRAPRRFAGSVLVAAAGLLGLARRRAKARRRP